MSLDKTPSVSTDILAFICKIKEVVCSHKEDAEIVSACMSDMLDFMGKSEKYLRPNNLMSNDNSYARNLLYVDTDKSLSLYCLVWKPGQWTPVHDHGSWGLVGVIEGQLEEHNFIRVDDQVQSGSKIILKRGGSSVLSPGSLTTFVPNPDHIHKTGVPSDGELTKTLHLYGKNMDRYNVYDLKKGSRSLQSLQTHE